MAAMDDTVISIGDDLSFGPIDPPDGALRAEWVGDVLGYCWEDVVEEDRGFWTEALADRPNRVAWVSRRSTNEFCGFLEWLRRNGDRPCEVVDLTDVTFPSDRHSGQEILLPITTMITPDQFVGARLWELAPPLTPDARIKWTALWDRLRTENAPFRILTPKGLESAPLDVFDQKILGCIGADWCKVALAAGRFLAATAEESLPYAGVHQTGDLVAIARIAALIEAGALECDGEPYEIHACRVRRPSDSRRQLS